MNPKFKILLLVLIIIVAAMFRLWQIGNVPPSPDWDEASLGYNAYSILNTGKDEYGQFLPIILRSFDDYKPGLYTYFIIPFIQLFGLNIVSVRLPSVIFGILAVIATYFFVKELFKQDKLEFIGRKINIEIPALLSTFLLAISPWHIQFSRVGFEACTGFAFNLFSFLFFLKGLKQKIFMVASFFIGAINVYIYQSEKVFTPIMFLMLLIIFRDQFLKINKKWIMTSFLVAILTVLPMFYYILTNQGALMRAKGVVSFSNQTEFLKRNSQKLVQDKANNDIIGLIIDNRRIEYAKSIVSGYISHFDINWLFITGDIARHHAPNMGLIYIFELPFILIGLYQFLFGNTNKKIKLAVIGYFLIVPIPASVTSGVPHAVRTINFLPIFQIFSSLGIIYSFIYFSRFNKKENFNIISKIVYIAIFLFAIFNIGYYINQYFVQLPYYNSNDWQYGYRQAIDYIKPISSRYNKIIVSNQAPLDQSYIFFLFYLKYDPYKYQQNGGTQSGGFKEVHKGFMDYTFMPIDLSKHEQGKILYIGRPEDYSGNRKLLKTIYYLDGTQAIKIFEE